MKKIIEKKKSVLILKEVEKFQDLVLIKPGIK